MIRSVSADGYAIALKYNSDFSLNTFLIELQSEELIWEKKLLPLPIFIDSNKLISVFKNLVIVFDNTGLELWSFDLKHLGLWFDYDKKEKSNQVSRVLGVYKNQIYLYLNSGKVLVLNQSTGEKVCLIENNVNADQGVFKGMFMNSIELDISKAKLIQIFNQRYTEVDLNNNIVSQHLIHEMYSLKLSNLSRCAFTEEHIFFTDKTHHKLASLNRSNLRIDWTFDLSESAKNKSNELGRFGRKLSFNHKRLFVTDNENALHIFE